MFRYLNEIQSGRTSSISHEIVGNVMLVVSATAGVVGMTQGELCRGEKIKLLFRHLIFRASRFLGIAVALEVPFFVVITKVNMVPEEQLKKISDTVASVLKSAGAKVPLVVDSSDDCITAACTSLNSDVVHMPGVGTVAGGLITQGIIVENMPLNVGPSEDGSFKTDHVRV